MKSGKWKFRPLSPPENIHLLYTEMLMEKVYHSPIRSAFMIVCFIRVAVASFSSAFLSAVMVSEDKRLRPDRLRRRRLRVKPDSSSSSLLRSESASESERIDISRSSELEGPPLSDSSCILPSPSECDSRRPLPLLAA